MIALIDADSIAFMLGWVHKDHQNIDEMHKSIDTFLENLFIMTGADMYYGALASPYPCFRYDTYKVKPYKGSRKELSEHMIFWRPVVNDYLEKQWLFDRQSVYDPGIDKTLEADDLVYTASLFLQKHGLEVVICSPDKDLKQIPGMHYDYRTNVFCTVNENQALYNFFMLMLQGDDCDGVCGIPGFGPKKAQEKLKPLLESGAERTSYEELVKALYHKHFGPHYGTVIYEETEKTLSLVCDHQREIQIQSVPEKAHPFETAND